jgi:hypothetical protein
MGVGLQAWDQNGNLIVNITDRLARFVGAVRLGGAAGSIYDATLLQGDAFYSFQQDFIWGYINNDISRPIFSYSNGTISWSYSPGQGVHNYVMLGWLFYGVK